MDKKKQNLKELENKVQEKDFWENKKRAAKISKEINNLKENIGEIEKLKKGIEELKELIEISEGDDSLRKEIEGKYQKLEKKLRKEEIKIFLSGKYDRNNAILEIFAGAGGVDAQDWATMLLRMFRRF